MIDYRPMYMTIQGRIRSHGRHIIDRKYVSGEPSLLHMIHRRTHSPRDTRIFVMAHWSPVSAT